MDFHTLFHTNWWIFPAHFSLVNGATLVRRAAGRDRAMSDDADADARPKPRGSPGCGRVKRLKLLPPEPRLNSGQGVSSRQVRALFLRQVFGCVCAQKSTNMWRMVVLRKIPTGFSLAEGLFETWGRINIKCASIFF